MTYQNDGRSDDRRDVDEAGPRGPIRHGRPGDRPGRAGERGFALLVSLIAIVGLTALATGGFFLANAERQMSTNHHAAVEAFHLANAGLSNFMGTVSGDPAAASPRSYSYTGDGGWADVTASFVGTARGDERLFLIESVGSYDPNGSGNAVTRRVAKIAVLNENIIPTPPAPLTSGGGITKNGSSGLISGIDQCGNDADRSAVRVPTDPGYSQSGGGDVLEGADPLADSVSNPFDFIPDAENWWQGMLDGTTVPHDHTLQSDDSSSNWPEFGETEMPVTYVDKNSINLGDEQDGRGLLIVKGDVSFGGNFDWDGIIVAGGTITDNGTGQIQGAVMSGLNTLFGEDVAQDDLENIDDLNGTKKYLFDSCIIDQLQNSLATVAGIGGTWEERY